MIHIATTHAAAALAALFLVAVPAAAQSLIEIPAETASARAGKWVVTADSTAAGGGTTMRNPDQGASKITTAKSSPSDYFELTFTPTRAFRTGCGCTAGPTATTGTTIRYSCSSRAASTRRAARLPHRDDLGNRGQPRGLQGLRPARLEVAGQRVGLRACSAGHLLRDHRHPADARADARRRVVDRSDHPVAIAVPEFETGRDFAGIGRLRRRRPRRRRPDR